MSADEITPARLRELADSLPEYSHALAPEIAAALRAAADQRERLTATLAAREALLRRAMKREKFIRGISPSVAAMFDEYDAPLAAEIAAALEQGAGDAKM